MAHRRGAYRVLVVKPEGKRRLGRPRRRWEIIVRWVFRKWDGMGAWNGFIWLKKETGGGHL